MKVKKIKIDDEKDYEKLIKNIKRYKRIFYRNTSFAIENNINDKTIEYIENALNIKNRRKRIEYIFDTSCKIIDENTNNKNICGFKEGKCFVQQRKKDGKCNGCCRKCLYQSKNGCLTKNLTCKLFYCSEVKTRYNVIKYEDLKLLKLLSIKNRCIIKHDFFSKREDYLKDLYSYTLTYSMIRIVIRLIKTYFKLRKK